MQFPSPNLGLSLKFTEDEAIAYRKDKFPSPNLGLSLKFTNRPLALKITCLAPSKSTLQAVRRSFTQNLSFNDVLTAPIPKAVLIPIPL